MISALQGYELCVFPQTSFWTHIALPGHEPLCVSGVTSPLASHRTVQKATRTSPLCRDCLAKVENGE